MEDQCNKINKIREDVITEDALLQGLARLEVRALNGAGYTSLSQLADETESELKAHHGMDPNVISKLSGRGTQIKGLNVSAGL